MLGHWINSVVVVPPEAWPSLLLAALSSHDATKTTKCIIICSCQTLPGSEVSVCETGFTWSAVVDEVL